MTKKKTLAIDKELHRKLKVRAAQKGIELTELVNQAIKDYLARNPAEETDRRKL